MPRIQYTEVMTVYYTTITTYSYLLVILNILKCPILYGGLYTAVQYIYIIIHIYNLDIRGTIHVQPTGISLCSVRPGGCASRAQGAPCTMTNCSRRNSRALVSSRRLRELRCLICINEANTTHYKRTL